MSFPQTYTLTLTTHAYGGESLGRLPDGRAVFVPFALPGETVQVRLVEEKRGYARGELVEVIAPAAQRSPSRCPHFGDCGGCHYQHMAYPAQLAAKLSILADQLERIGRIVDPPVRPIVPSQREFHYRNHVQFHLASDGHLGYRKARSNETLAIRECHLPEELLNDIWPLIDIEPLAGLSRVSLRLGAGEDILLLLESDDPHPPEMSVEELPISVFFIGPEGSQVLAGSDHIVAEVLGRPFCVSAASFFQVNTAAAERMIEHVMESLPLTSTDTVLDVYAGVGLFSAFLAPRVERLIAIESAPSACEDFVSNLDEFDNVELYAATAEEVLPALNVRPKAIVVDPPRAGVDRHALDALIALNPERVAYVSCDPTTLARDTRRLMTGSYRLESITPFDLFPQTYHIESISLWVKA